MVIVKKTIKGVYLAKDYVLPDTYQEVEWIGCSGTQYLSNITMPVDFKFTINASFSTTTSYYNIYDNNDVTPKCMLWINGSGKLELNEAQTQVVDFVKDAFIEVVSDNTGSDAVLYVEGTQVLQLSKVSSIAANILLLHRGNSDGFKGRIKNIKIENSSNTILYNFIPCYRKSDNVIGMYDLANNVFYTNQGSGNFTKGANANPYIIIRSTAYIPNDNTVAYYPLTSTSTISDMKGSGTAYDLTNAGYVTFGTYNGVSCAGFTKGQATSTLYNSSISFGAYPTYTVSCWFYYNYTGSRYNTIWTIGNTAKTGLLGFRYNNGLNGGSIALGAFDEQAEVTTQMPLTANKWYHLVVVSQGNTCKLYLNNELVLTLTSPLSGTQTQLNLGKPGHNNNDTLGGGISDFILENVAWTDEQRADYYNLTKLNYGY